MGLTSLFLNEALSIESINLEDSITSNNSSRDLAVIDIDTADPMAATAEQPLEYPSDVIKPNDKLNIRVYREPELTGVFTTSSVGFTVDSYGNLDYPLLGRVRVKDLTLEQLQQLITIGLGSKYIVDPQVHVSFAENSVSNSVSILGQVKKPGNYPIVIGFTTLTRLLSEAGGFNQIDDSLKGMRELAERREVKVVRTNSQGEETLFVVNSERIVQGHDEDFYLMPGDRVFVPERNPKENVSILGEVSKPGNYNISEGMTLIRLISDAGGFSRVNDYHKGYVHIADLTRVKIIRTEFGNQSNLMINVQDIINGKAEDVDLNPGDIILVSSRDSSSDVVILGQVNQPGNYYTTVNMTLTRAISEAKGLTRYADYHRVYLNCKNGHGEIKTSVVDMHQILTGAKPDIPLQPGDTVYVPEAIF